MNMEFSWALRMIVALFAVYVLDACGGKSSPAPVGPPAATAAQTPGVGSPLTNTNGPASIANGPAMGTSDRGGGGNLIHGKPIDFYAKDITTLPEFQRYLKPIDQKMATLIPMFRGTSMLTVLAKMKTWYLVPVSLDQLPKEKLGLGFSSDQGAVQTENEVFITTLEKQTPEAKAQLLLHELVMIFYRLKYKEFSAYCGFFPDVTPAQCLKILMPDKDNLLLQPEKTTVFLNPGEYEPIRHVTEWLFTHTSELNQKNFNQKMMDKKFDVRVFNFNWSEEEEKKVISREKLIAKLQEQEKMGTLPDNCGFTDEFPMVAKSKCAVHFSFDPKANRLYLDLAIAGTKKDAKKFLYEFGVYQDGEPQKNELVLHRQIYRSGMQLHLLSLAIDAPLGDRPVYNLQFGIEVYKDQIEIKHLRLMKSYQSQTSPPSSGYYSSKITALKLTDEEKTIGFISTQNTLPVYPGEVGR